MKYLSLLAYIALLAGCAAFEPETWLNRGHVDIDATKTGLAYCYTDANLVDGERMSGTICGHPTSGFFMKGEPMIEFGPWGFKFMSALVSETTTGVQREYEGKRVFLKCSPVTGPDGHTEIGRDCEVTMNDQHLVAAKFIFKKI